MKNLNLMETNFNNHLSQLSSDDQAKGIPSRVIARWTNSNVEAVNILMALLGWKGILLDEEKYWFTAETHDEFLNGIGQFLLNV